MIDIDARHFLWILALALSPVAAAQDDAPSFVLITLDTTRADHLEAYGDANAETPNLLRLAGEGALFERAYATAPVTLPTHASILTGLAPPRHGIRDIWTAVGPVYREVLGRSPELPARPPPL